MRPQLVVSPAQTAALAALVRCIKVEVYALQRQEGQLKALLQALADQVPRHACPRTLQECLHSLAHLAAQEHAVRLVLDAHALLQQPVLPTAAAAGQPDLM